MSTSNHPLNVTRYIKLITDSELSDDEVKQWYRTVKDNAPSGIICSVQVVTRGKPVSAMLVHRKADKKHEYVISLTRELTEGEAEAVVQAWDAHYPAGDMDIEISATQAEKMDQDAPSVRVPNDQYLGLCIELAKTQHVDWLRDRTDQGWRFGPTVSLKNKTHPLMRPWEQLPAQYRKIDQDTPQRVLSLLNNQGYAVVKQAELDSLLKLLRSAM
jgi:hypothetical protein